MKERCRDGCRTSLLIAGVVLVLAIFHTSLPLCHPYITIHFMEMIFSTCIQSTTVLCDTPLWYIVKVWNFPLFSADHHCGNQSGIDVVIGRLEVDNTGVGESSAQSQGIVNLYPFTIISKGYRIAKLPP